MLPQPEMLAWASVSHLMPGLSALGAVALLELFAAAAPAGVVAAELLVLARVHGLGHDAG